MYSSQTKNWLYGGGEQEKLQTVGFKRFFAPSSVLQELEGPNIYWTQEDLRWYLESLGVCLCDLVQIQCGFEYHLKINTSNLSLRSLPNTCIDVV